MHFSKYHGLGNDFILIDRRSKSLLSRERCIALCERHRGIGADGVIALLDEGGLKMHVTNSDGSVPEMCGNGLRCLARYLVSELNVHDLGQPFEINTGAGMHRVTVDEQDVEIVFPGPIFNDVALCSEGEFVDAEHVVDGQTYRGTFVSTGNPHFVVMKSVSEAEARVEGPRLQASSLFPQGANIGFCEVIDTSAIRLVVFERGAGLTQACGTGALAAVSALVKNGIMPPNQEVRVRLLGGDLFIAVAPDFAKATMRGPAEFLFSGLVEV